MVMSGYPPATFTDLIVWPYVVAWLNLVVATRFGHCRLDLSVPRPDLAEDDQVLLSLARLDLPMSKKRKKKNLVVVGQWARPSRPMARSGHAATKKKIELAATDGDLDMAVTFLKAFHFLGGFPDLLMT